MLAKNVKTGLLAAALVLGVRPDATAQDARPALPGSFSGNVAIVSDYIVRGISLSNEDPAIQGGLDWMSDNGFYLGTWGSSVEFGNDSSAEIDFYGGYRGRVGPLSYEAGIAYYWYPATTAVGSSFWDVHVEAGYDFGPAALNFGLAYTPDNFGPAVSDSVWYPSAGVAFPVAEMLTISGGVGYSFREGADNYTDWNAGASLRVYNWFTVDARYYDTNFTACGPLCETRFVVKVSRFF